MKADFERKLVSVRTRKPTSRTNSTRSLLLMPRITPKGCRGCSVQEECFGVCNQGNCNTRELGANPTAKVFEDLERQLQKRNRYTLSIIF